MRKNLTVDDGGECTGKTGESRLGMGTLRKRPAESDSKGVIGGTGTCGRGWHRLVLIYWL